MTPEPIKITRVRIMRAALAQIPGRLRDWWQLQRDRAREPFDLPDWPETDELAVRSPAGVTDQELADAARAVADAVAMACGPRAELAPSRDGLVILPWICPMCSGHGRCDSLAGRRCLDCDGRGAITDEAAKIWAEVENAQLRPAPTPPAVMKKPCGDCAFRPGAPEEEARPSLERPFYCHHGMPIVRGSYAPTAWARGMPLGAMVCAGWWAAATGKDLPARAYRAADDGWGDASGDRG